MFRFDHSKTRPATTYLLDLAEQGVIDWETLARDCLGWMSEYDVAEMTSRLDYVPDDGEEDGDA